MMRTILQIDKLILHLGKGKHDTGDVIAILPFSTKPSKEVRDQFFEVLGELTRNICGLEFKRKKRKSEDELSYTSNPVIDQILHEIEYSPGDEYDLVRFLNQHLFGQDNQIKITHPYLYNLISVPEKDVLKKYGHFIHNILIQDNEEIEALFQAKETNDILTELILSKLELPRREGGQEKEYQPLFDGFTKLYQDDLLYMSKHKEYFLSNFPLLTHFYIFMYVCQVIAKFDKFTNANYQATSPFYFALEWESMSKRRKAAEDTDSFRWVKEKASDLFVHVHTMSQLSHIEDGENKNIKFHTYHDLLVLLEKQGVECEQQYLRELKEWIQKYRELFPKRVTEKEEPATLTAAFRTLFESIKQGMHPDAWGKYGKNIEDLGGQVFLKNRGNLGTVFNMNHDLLLLLTAVCVKDKRIPLNKLFDEMSVRGVAFDRHSKKAIIELFDSLNILDKKSDSGDAQYVKPIL
jgi:DNA phosphorothioation-dependent restriction protein DptG